MPSIYERQSKYFNPETQTVPVTIIGCGSLGGFIGYALAKMGFKDFNLYDFDKVENHNIPNQPFAFYNVGDPKTRALSELISSQIEDSSNVRRYDKWDSHKIPPGIIINTPDCIVTRKKVFEQVVEQSGRRFIVDARSGPSTHNLYFCDTKDKKSVEFYKNTFFDPEDSVTEGCGAQSTIFGNLDVAAYCTNVIMRKANKEPVPLMVVTDLMTLERNVIYS